MNDNFMAMLESARDHAKVPFVINSGFRCTRQNNKVSGVASSSHLTGRGCDIRTMDSVTRYRVLEAAFEVGFNRIGIADSFIHLDSDEAKPMMVAWTYS